MAEITARHDPEFEAKLLKRADEAPTSLAERSVLEARGSVNCAAQAQWAEANLQPIYDGVRYLRGLSGQTNQETGCKRVSCSYSGSIWLCNDVSAVLFHLLSGVCANRLLQNASNLKIGWGAVADAAYEVAETCHWCYGANNAPVCKVKGQGFQSGNWNVVVRAADC